ncbi:unnamed protein product [Nezara viridula]|uniref:C2 domain-containing protein n=1 Tax=Nezara viridula TaxID=85310 RepID=A0A9P0HBP3_NEZVI|nr:unnamed protein product [Nezara viridula]
MTPRNQCNLLQDLQLSVALHLIPNERRTQQSRQKKKTCNPFFDETFVFQVSEKELADHSLRMTVLDTGRNKKSNVIGHVTFPLRHLATEHPTDQLELLKMDLEKVRSRKADTSNLMKLLNTIDTILNDV